MSCPESNPDFLAWIRTQPCLIATVTDCLTNDCSNWPYPTRSCAAHVVKTRQHGDLGLVVPLCSHHHMEQHTIGVKSFAEKWGVDLAKEAHKVAQAFQGRPDEGFVF